MKIDKEMMKMESENLQNGVLTGESVDYHKTNKLKVTNSCGGVGLASLSLSFWRLAYFAPFFFWRLASRENRRVAYFVLLFVFPF